MTFGLNRKKEKLDSLKVVKITYMLRFGIKLVFMQFDKYKNKLKNQRSLLINRYNYLYV